jgi:hypothetical protein
VRVYDGSGLTSRSQRRIAKLLGALLLAAALGGLIAYWRGL